MPEKRRVATSAAATMAVVRPKIRESVEAECFTSASSEPDSSFGSSRSEVGSNFGASSSKLGSTYGFSSFPSYPTFIHVLHIEDEAI